MMILPATTLFPKVDRVSVPQRYRGLDGARRDAIRVRLPLRELHGHEQVVGAGQIDQGLRLRKNLYPGLRHCLAPKFDSFVQHLVDEARIGRMPHLGVI